jgi:hypothetical protein
LEKGGKELKVFRHSEQGGNEGNPNLAEIVFCRRTLSTECAALFHHNTNIPNFQSVAFPTKEGSLGDFLIKKGGNCEKVKHSNGVCFGIIALLS